MYTREHVHYYYIKNGPAKSCEGNVKWCYHNTQRESLGMQSPFYIFMLHKYLLLFVIHTSMSV